MKEKEKDGEKKKKKEEESKEKTRSKKLNFFLRRWNPLTFDGVNPVINV